MLFNERLAQFLTAENGSHRLRPHQEEFSAGQVPPITPVPRREWAEGVVVRDAAGEYPIIVLPANCVPDLAAVATATGRQGLHRATAEEAGDLSALPVYVDACFRNAPPVFFRGGNPQMAGVRFQECERQARPVVGQWCFHAERRAA